MKTVKTEKRTIEVEVPVITEDDSKVEFMDALGKEVCIFGMIYIYSGKLVGVNDTHVVLEDAGIVYETGSFQDSNWKDFQKLPCKEHKVRKAAVESWFEVKR